MRPAILLAIALSLAVGGWAQVRGVIQDARGSLVAGARVTAHSSAEPSDKVALSGADGSFEFDNLAPGHYQFKAAKRGYGDSAVAEHDLSDGESLTVNLTLTANAGFFKRLSAAYSQDWHGSSDTGPEPPRRALPSQLNSPPFPNSDWSYGGSPVIGEPDTNVPPLMQALYGGSNGDAWEQSRVKIYGWVEGSFNLSTSHDSNYPSAYDIFANRVEFDQAVLYVERIPDSVQTDHFDWGFHLTGLYGTSYRFTTNLGYFSSQLIDDHRQYGFDPALEYVDLYFPQFAEGINIRIGRFISIPGIEAQLAPNNYVYTHSLLYAVDPFTDTGVLATIRLNEGLLLQLGITASHDVAPWTRDAKPAATACISYTFHQGNDNLYPCVNGLNKGGYAYNNLQMFDNTWYHKFNASWHMASEAWYMYQRGVPSVLGPLQPEKGTYGAFCCAGEIRCFAPEWAAVNYVERQLNAKNYLSIRSDFLDDIKGQRTGYKNRYAACAIAITLNRLLRSRASFADDGPRTPITCDLL
ncbi:MAG: TonB-dependent receptor, partial [Bryobacteraceae bacterium]